MEANRVPIIEVRGRPRELGRQQGEAAREIIRAALHRYREILPKALGLPWERAELESRKFLPYAEQAFPQYVDELRGISDGATAPFQDVWTLNCYEGITVSHEQVWGCTSVAVRDDQTSDGHVLLAHNEDWISTDRENVYLVRAEPEGEPPFIGMTYGPLLVNIGFNAEGVGVAIDAVYPTDGGVGVPRILCSRAVLQARTIVDAIRACVPKLRAGGYGYVLADPNGEIYSVETSATTHDILYGDDGVLVHTNHYQSARMKALEQPGRYANSNTRLNRARRLVRDQRGSVTLESLMNVLRDHVGYPNSICRHEDSDDPAPDREMTLVSLVMDLTDREMWASPGPPCGNDYTPYRL